MSETITGVVEKINEMQSPSGAPRKWTKKSFSINGEWFGNFLTKENITEFNAVNEGDAVKATFETKGQYKNLTKIEVIGRDKGTGANVVQVLPMAPQPASTTTTTTPYNVQDKDYRITYLAARRDAIEFVKSLVQLDILPLGTKKSDKADNFYAYVKEYAAKFAEDAYVSREQNAVPTVKEESAVVE
jgi:hypothetical protein